LLGGIRDILEIQGYHVLTASNGTEGLTVLRGCDRLPDLIVSDIMMPGMDGYKFLEQVRQENQWMSIPFIFLTAKSEKNDVRAGKLMGADDYLTKPFEAADLEVVVASKLKRRREIDQVRDGEVSDIKKRILTILHHEFRTPMTYVVAYSDLLQREFSDLSREEMQEFLNGISSGADRLRRLVENFILLVDLDAGEATNTYNWRKRTIKDLTPIISQAIEEEQAYATKRGVEILVRPPASPLPAIVGDVEYLKAAIARLVDNAIKFSEKPNSVVQITSYTRNGSVWISVLDHGRGIPASALDSIFDVFYQYNRHLYEDQGAGAGLSIVRRIVELHQGTVRVNSHLGEGSEFLIGIPVAES